MSTPQQSTIDLPDLPGIGKGWELLLSEAERARRCTGSTAAAAPELREQIVHACATLGTRRVADAFGVSREVVRALRSEAIRTGKLDQVKEAAGRRALAAADAILDRISDEIDELPKSALALTYGILQDKGMLLTGQPTARIEHTVGSSHAELNDWIESLPAANPVSAGDPSGQKAAALELHVPAESAQVLDGSDRARDSQSLVFRPTTSEPSASRAEGGQNQTKKEAGHE